jgi:hypothetical protein
MFGNPVKFKSRKNLELNDPLRFKPKGKLRKPSKKRRRKAKARGK